MILYEPEISQIIPPNYDYHLSFTDQTQFRKAKIIIYQMFNHF